MVCIFGEKYSAKSPPNNPWRTLNCSLCCSAFKQDYKYVFLIQNIAHVITLTDFVHLQGFTSLIILYFNSPWLKTPFAGSAPSTNNFIYFTPKRLHARNFCRYPDANKAIIMILWVSRDPKNFVTRDRILYRLW